MLRFVFGRAGSGKSEYCLGEIERLARLGQRSILVVPEQSSYSFERALALRLEGNLAAFCSIRSFRRLSEDVFSECGGGAKRRVNDAEKCAVLRRALGVLEGELRIYRRHRRDRAFFSLAVSVIEELKNGGVSPDGLREAAGRARTPLSRDRMTELARIYETYEALLERQYMDGADELLAAARLCGGAARFAGTTVFLDGYSGFTHPEMEMIGALLQNAGEVVCTLCCAGDIFEEREDAFAAVRATARSLRALAARRQVPLAKPVTLEGSPRFCSAGLALAERFYADGRLPQSADAQGLYQITGADLYEEAQLAAQEICTLVREHGYRFSDIAVVARDADRYRFAVGRTFERYGIPLFADEVQEMLHTSFSAFVLGCFELAQGMRTDAVFQLLKTGLCALDEQQVSELENYCFVWNIDSGGWMQPFDRRPDGFGDPDERTKPLIERIEQSRALAAGWFMPFVSKAHRMQAAELVEAVWALMERCGAVSALEHGSEEERRQAQLGIGLLDRLHDLVGQENYTPAELAELYTLMASGTSVGEIPQSLEQVAFGAADRMRTQNPRAVFVLGLNDGVFPKTSFEAPLLNYEERDLLVENGAALSRDFAHSAEMERLYLYRAVSAARERLYLCCARADQRGTGLQPEPQTALFCAAVCAAEPDCAAAPLPEAQNLRTAALAYALALERGESEICGAVRQSGFSGVCGGVDAAASVPDYTAKDSALPRALLGERSALSASKIEQFEKCRFAYFLKYMLRVRPLERAEISPVEAGSFVHAVLEQTLREFDGDLTRPDEAQLRESCARAAQDYAEAHLGETAAKPRIRYLIERLKTQSARLVLQLRREQQQSEFRPADYELEIGDAGAVPPLELRTPHGETVYVEGKIDRVDLFNKDGRSYIRVVDYKTGPKSFSLSDVFYGLNMQMLLYLFTLCRNGGARYRNPVPAGVLYMPADPTPPTAGEDLEKEARKAYKMDGLVLDDPEVAAAMEKELAGVFIPVQTNRDGSLQRSRKLASLEKLGRIEQHIEKIVSEMAAALYDGQWDVCPVRSRSNDSACDWCEYAAVCRRDRHEKDRMMEKLDESRLFEADEEVEK